MTRAPRHQAGFALVSAIFLIVVLAALGAFMVTIGGVQHATTSQAVLAARAYFGAKAGIEWGIHQAIAPTPSMCTSIYPTMTTTLLAPITGLDGIRVTVSCACTFTSAANCNSALNSVYYLASVAEYGTYGSADYAQRRLEATVTGIP